MSDTALRDLLKISHAVGGDEDLTQVGGGNTSVKTARGTMLIKASGTRLAEMREDRGWVELNLQGLLALLDDARLRGLPAQEREAALLRHLAVLRVGGPGERPSVECVVHALLDTVVVHTHPVAANVYGCAQDGERALRELDGTGADADSLLWLPYGDPGYPLALALRDGLQAHAQNHEKSAAIAIKMIIQANHGFFVHAARPDDALAAHREFLKACDRALPYEVPQQHSPDESRVRSVALAIRGGHGRLHHPDTDDRIECHTAPLVRLLERPELAAAATHCQLAEDLAAGALTPDGIVYTGPAALHLSETENRDAILAALKDYQQRHGLFPKLIIADQLGTFAVGASPAQLEATAETAAANARLLLRLRAIGYEPRFMGDRDVEYIKNWEVETYRAKQLSGTMGASGGGPLAGRIAVVTGAGSGLGKGIASGLAGAGAVVFFADIDLPAAQEAAESVNASGGRQCGTALSLDVTSEASVAEAFARVIRLAGGVDIVVNCAGIAPAHELVDFPLDQWERTLQVNLTGYFLVTREAARIMREQGVGGAVICLSSKSGLEASKANSAYAATKAGEIHLARGWALELARDLIRVNCVAPGNVFEGSKIWNPDYIKKAAEKRGIQPDEVIPYYISLSPLQKEIQATDVAEAVIFLCSDAARRITGQVLAVDGGQVMVR